MRMLRGGLCGVVALAAVLPLRHADAQAVDELKLKSAFLYNFTKFVEWPTDRFANDADPIVIGVFADDATQAEIAATVLHRHVNGRAVEVLPIVTATDLQRAHILFVSRDEEPRYLSLRRHAQLDAVLTIGDHEDCRAHGGAICFTRQGDKLRFEINMDTAEHLRLRISSQLQKLAVVVNKTS